MTEAFHCRVCGGTHVEAFLDLGDQPHCNRLIRPERAAEREPHYPLRVGFCHDCTLVQIDYTVPKEQMFSDYPYVSGTTRTLVEHFRETAERLRRGYGLGPDSLVVDIGSNDGTWLAGYEAGTVRTLGVEPASNVAAIANGRGIRTLNRFFNEETAEAILAADGPASLVTAAGVFFHLEELHSVVRGIRRLLAPDGTFVVQAIYLGGMIENLAFDQVYHEHLCYYTLRSLEALFARHGLEVVDVDLVPVHGGSLEVHVAHRGHRAASPRVAAFRAREAERGYGELATYRAFADRVWALRDALLVLLEDYAAKGRSVFAYGAPAKGATLLNSFGIGPRLVRCAVEKNPMKVGAAIPGVRIPILDEAAAGKPDAYLMLAWNFLDEFLAKEAAYLRAGGEFVVPVPALRVVTAADIPDAA
ncbi:MAG TPA: class I SAM-dependent methyltransferase [Alphaproteobacteria bacterium]|nr:class I SAM-dependent methyltransferase [Alphaproteobacteria bacterium]